MINKESPISVVLPVYNEEGCIGEIVEKTDELLRKKGIFEDFEIVAVDDGSRDNSAAILKELSGKIPSLKVITHKNNLGYGKALTSGIRNSGHPLILFMDADGQFDISEIDKVIPYIHDYDVIAGYRQKREDNLYRVILGKVYGLLIFLLFGLRSRDINCGFKLFKKQCLSSEDLDCVSGGFFAEALLVAKNKGCKIKEVPIKHLPRLRGRSTGSSLKVIVASIVDLFKLNRRLRRAHCGLFFMGLAGVLSLGFILRIFRLDSKVIWYDEACSLAYVQQGWGNYLWDYFNYKPFSFFLLKIWTGIFGVSAFPARFLSVIFSTLSIYLIYQVGKRLFDRKVGIFSALFLSISCFHIYHSQQARQMSLIAFLWLVSYLLCVRIFFENKANLKLVFLNSVVNVLSVFTHPYGLAIIVSQNLFFMTIKEKPPKLINNWYLGQFMTFLFLLPWFFLPQQQYMNDLLWWIPHLSGRIFWETLETFSFGGPRYGLDDFKIKIWYLYAAGYLLVAAYVSLLLFGLFKNGKPESRNELSKKIFLLIWLFCPILLAALVSLYRQVYLIKHLIYVLPAFCLLCGLGLSKIQRKIARVALLLLVIIASVFPLYVMYANDFNIDWRSPASYIRDNMGEKDTIIISNLNEIVPFMYYFNYGDPAPLKGIGIFGRNTGKGWLSAFPVNGHCIIGISGDKGHNSTPMLRDFNSLVFSNRFGWMNNDIWLASSRWGKKDVLDYMTRFFLDKHYRLAHRVSFGGVEVFHFLKPESRDAYQ